MAIPITILTGFLGAGKTTLVLNLIPQLPRNYKLALVKNEFGDVAIDSQLASSAAISGVQELLGGCICCNLVGRLGDALETLRHEVQPDRIILETSGSAMPFTLVQEITRLIREGGGQYVIDGVVNVIDAQNWTGFGGKTYSLQLQAQYTDLIVLNKWEDVDERRLDTCLDWIGDLVAPDADDPPPVVRSDRGKVSQDVLFGIDGSLARKLAQGQDLHAEHSEHSDQHGHEHHSSEVEVLSCSMQASGDRQRYLDLASLMKFLELAPKTEILRIKAQIFLAQEPKSSGGEEQAAAAAQETDGANSPRPYLLNWAFGRWTFTAMKQERKEAEAEAEADAMPLRMTIITARSYAKKWMKKIERSHFLRLVPAGQKHEQEQEQKQEQDQEQDQIEGQLDIRLIS